jgi:putative phosphonate metabolism protein
MTTRFALYVAPPADHPLHGFAARWLGWDPESGETHDPEPAAGFSASRIAALTAEPRRYGFHGTLKPPFRLAEGCSDSMLIAALERFAARHAPVRLPALQIAALGTFLALRPSAPCPAIDDLAAACVRDFDAFRAPPSEAELARRRQAGLTPRQESHLARWGYPYVLEDFRLHFTLTGSIDNTAERAALLEHLSAEVAPLLRSPMIVSELCLFAQSGSDAPFRIVGRYRFNS